MNQVEIQAPAIASFTDAAKPKKFQPFGPRAHRFAFRPPEQDARINVLSGSVRSAKTWSTLVKILLLCRYEVSGRKVITGVSKQAIYQNVLLDLFEVLHPSQYNYNRQSGELTIRVGGKQSSWICLGAADEGSEKGLRGMTIGVAVCDELVKMPKSFFMMLMSRLSPANSRLYATTNPDNPYHWVKAELLDNDKLRHGLGKDLWWDTFTFEDNPSLTQDYKDFLRRSYTGVWYERFVLGNWVQASGSVFMGLITEDILYDDATRPIGLLHRGGHVDKFLSIDMGTTNAFAVVELIDQGQTLYADRELYWDSKREGRQKSNSEYRSDIEAFVAEGTKDERDWPSSIIVDPSAASFKVELNQRGYYVMDAENEVLEGIRKVSALLANKRLRIHRRCVNLIRELQSYAWDEKRSDKGVEQPIKAHDHACFVAGTMVRTPYGSAPIEHLLVGDSVVTPLGVCKVRATESHENRDTVAWNGTRVTPEHPVLTDSGLRRVDMVRYNDRICEWNPSFSTASHFGVTRTQSVSLTGTTLNQAASTLCEASRACIARCGRLLADQFRTVSMSIMPTKIPGTMSLATSNCFPVPNTYPGTQVNRSEWPQQGGISKLPASRRQNGTDLLLAESGIRRWPRKQRSTEHSTITRACTAAPHSDPRTLAHRTIRFVLTTANRLPGANLVWTMFPGLARAAAWSLGSIAISKSAPVADLADVRCERVYSLRTEHGCYFANGVLVSNCDALRYGVATKWSDWRIAA